MPDEFRHQMAQLSTQELLQKLSDQLAQGAPMKQAIKAPADIATPRDYALLFDTPEGVIVLADLIERCVLRNQYDPRQGHQPDVAVWAEGVKSAIIDICATVALGRVQLKREQENDG